MNSEEKTVKMTQGLKMALIRSIAALVAAILLLVLTGFSAFSMIKGPKEVGAIFEGQESEFVKTDVFAILGFYGDDSLYAVVPSGDKLATVHFTKRYLDSAKAVKENTDGVFSGTSNALDKYVAVQGTESVLSEEESGLMYDWFAENKDRMVNMHLISETDDYAQYISDQVLLVDTVDYRSQNSVIVFSAIALICFVYFFVELVLMASGFYMPGRKKIMTLEELEAIPIEENENEETDCENQESTEIEEENEEVSDEEKEIEEETEDDKSASEEENIEDKE